MNAPIERTLAKFVTKFTNLDYTDENRRYAHGVLPGLRYERIIPEPVKSSLF
jgi:hypothetical protein